MADAWGGSWGVSWGVSWGAGVVPASRLVWADRVHQTGHAAGTGPITLSGTPPAKRTFASVLFAGDVCYGCAAGPNEWEVTLFTMQTDGTLTRQSPPLSSSNGGASVNFSGATLDVFIDVPAFVYAASLSTPGYIAVAR